MARPKIEYPHQLKSSIVDGVAVKVVSISKDYFEVSITRGKDVTKLMCHSYNGAIICHNGAVAALMLLSKNE